MHHTLSAIFCAFPCHNVLINVRRERFFYIFVIVFRFPAKIRHTLGASKFIGSFQLVSVLNSHIRSHINNLSLGKQKLEASFA